MKKTIQILAALLVLGLVAAAPAQTLLSTIAAGARDTTVQEDQSKLPDQDNRVGYMSFLYNVADHGGTGTVAIGPALGDNVAIRGGFAQVVTAVTPATATNSLGVLNASDLLATGTTLQSTGLKALNQASASYVIAAGTATNTILSLKAPIETSSASNQVNVTWTGATATQGVFLVVLDLLKIQ